VTDFRALLSALTENRVEFILVGGSAAAVYGSKRLTLLDVVYLRTTGNIRRLAKALAPHAPYPRGSPAGIAFVMDEESLSSGMNFTLTTLLGDVDLLGQLAGGEVFEDLVPSTISINTFGLTCRALTLRRLIELNRASGRLKDLDVIAELEAI
jgi:hypothetical protein